MDLKEKIREIPDFPKKGVIFKDITPLLRDPAAVDEAARRFLKLIEGKRVDAVAGIESRGFIFGSILADRLGVGFVPIRKAGKLPHETISVSYELEYDSAVIEVHKDAVQPGQDVLLVDDLLATGGTAAAAVELIRKLGGDISLALFLVELEGLGGRDKLENVEAYSLISYEE